VTFMMRSLTAGCFLLAFATGARAADPIGTWYTEQQRAQIRIAKCDDTLCGTIVALKEPIDPDTGQPQTDTENEDATMRSRPVIGIKIVIGMKPSGANKWSGQLYNAEDGKTYTGSLTITGANSLKVEGCIMGGLLCRSQIWMRAN
jgi:uncharacterized protein (DUF2147 family)